MTYRIKFNSSSKPLDASQYKIINNKIYIVSNNSPDDIIPRSCEINITDDHQLMMTGYANAFHEGKCQVLIPIDRANRYYKITISPSDKEEPKFLKLMNKLNWDTCRL